MEPLLHPGHLLPASLLHLQAPFSNHFGRWACVAAAHFGFVGHGVAQGEVVAAAGGGDGLEFRSTRVAQPLAASTPAEAAGGTATLGVRAEHVRVSPSDDGAGRVTLTEPLGDETLVFFEFGGAAPLVAKVDPDSPLAPGDPVAFDFDRDWCHLFDAGSGARLN